MQVKTTQAISCIIKYLQAKLAVLLTGSPGIGKSDIMRQIAKDFNLKVIDLRLSQCDPTDLSGFPTIVGNKASYVPMSTFPLEGDPIPEGYSGWLLFLDEITSAPPAIQAASYKIVLDRMVGQDHLHKNVAIVCAGNLDTDNAIVQPMSTALQSRLVHLELVVDLMEFQNWAASSGISYLITSYLNFKPGNLYTFSPDHTDKTYACPRTWEFANRVLSVADINSPEILPMLAGTLSEGVAREFLGFTKIHSQLPTIAQITSNPMGIKVPDEPSILWALGGSISHHANMTIFGDLMKFIERMPIEFQVVCLRETVRRNKTIGAHPSMQNWISKNASLLF